MFGVTNKTTTSLTNEKFIIKATSIILKIICFAWLSFPTIHINPAYKERKIIPTYEICYTFSDVNKIGPHAGITIWQKNNNFIYNISIDYESHTGHLVIIIARILSVTANNQHEDLTTIWHEFYVEINNPNFINICFDTIRGQLAFYNVATGMAKSLPPAII